MVNRCDGCSCRCELGYTISETSCLIAPRVGDVTYWEHDVYSVGARLVLYTKFVGSRVEKARLKSLAINRAKLIAANCAKTLKQK